MSFSVNRFGDGESIVTDVMNRPIDQIETFLRNQMEDNSISFTRYGVGDEISDSVMNQPLIEIRDYLNSISQCSGTLSLDLYQNGEDVVASVLNRPIDQIVQFINNECVFEEEISDPVYSTIDIEKILNVSVGYGTPQRCWVHGEAFNNGGNRNQYLYSFDVNQNSISNPNDPEVVLEFVHYAQGEQFSETGILRHEITAQELQTSHGWDGVLSDIVSDDGGPEGTPQGDLKGVGAIRSLTADDSGCYLYAGAASSSEFSGNVRTSCVIKIDNNKNISWICLLPWFKTSVGDGKGEIKNKGDVLFFMSEGCAGRIDKDSGEVIWSYKPSEFNGDDWSFAENSLETSDGRITFAWRRLGIFMNPVQNTGNFRHNASFSITEDRIVLLAGYLQGDSELRAQYMIFDHDGELIDFYLPEYAIRGPMESMDSSGNRLMQANYKLASSATGTTRTFITNRGSFERIFRFFQDSDVSGEDSFGSSNPIIEIYRKKGSSMLAIVWFNSSDMKIKLAMYDQSVNTIVSNVSISEEFSSLSDFDEDQFITTREDVNDQYIAVHDRTKISIVRW